MNWIWSWWGWLIKPKLIWPKPPYNDDQNMRGLGWAGDKGELRPFERPKGEGL